MRGKYVGTFFLDQPVIKRKDGEHLWAEIGPALQCWHFFSEDSKNAKDLTKRADFCIDRRLACEFWQNRQQSHHL